MSSQTKSVTLKGGMTHGEAYAAVAALWPQVRLYLYKGTPAYYHEGSFFAKNSCTSETDVLRPDKDESAGRQVGGPIVITGATSSRDRRDLIYAAFGLESEFESVWPSLSYHLGDTLDEMQSNTQRWIEAFTRAHGRPPGTNDSFAGLSPKK